MEKSKEERTVPQNQGYKGVTMCHLVFFFFFFKRNRIKELLVRLPPPPQIIKTVKTIVKKKIAIGKRSWYKHTSFVRFTVFRIKHGLYKWFCIRQKRSKHNFSWQPVGSFPFETGTKHCRHHTI